MIKCPNCSAELTFDPGTQNITCQYCGSTFNVEELNEKVSVSKEEKSYDPSIEGKEYQCSQCGATLMTFDNTAVTFCSYCGSQAMLESKMIKHNNPDYIIPFKKTKEECIKAYLDKVNSFLFAPNYMKANPTVEKFRGIYMPYGIYKLTHEGNCNNKGEKYSHRSGDYVYYDQYDINCDVDASYDGISFDLVSNYADKFSTSIPFNYSEKTDFNPNYLSGFYADSYDVDKETYYNSAINIVRDDTIKRMNQAAPFAKYGCSSPKVNLKVTDEKTAMYPVYFLGMRSKDNKHMHYAVVNGQTGKVAVDLPIDFNKYMLVSLIIALVLFLVINNFLVLTPKTVVVFGLIANILSIFFSQSQIGKINKRRSFADDLGVKFIKENNSEEQNTSKKNNKEKSFKYIFKNVIGILLAGFSLVVELVNDEYYYTIALISLALVLLSFLDLVKEHNMLVSNEMPQLKKRGGDRS